MSRGRYVTITGYVIKVVTEKAIGINKARPPFDADLTWLPRSMVQDGDTLDVGDTDIIVREGIAADKDLDY